ncbi:MAG: hypothetical protein ACJAUD_002411 [Crocinitomicaceae bacterium]|jgi:hypothetical protein
MKKEMNQQGMNHEEKMEFYAKETLLKTKDILGWMTFFGILSLLGILGSVFVIASYFR